MAERARRYLWVAVQLPLFAAFVGYRIAATISYPPAVWQDSEGYKAVAANGWFTARLWAGPRSPLVPVLMKLSGTYNRYLLVQAIVGALAWAFLAYSAGRLVPNSWRKPVMTALVLGFAASPLVVMWDGSALSESPSLSILALLWAGGIWLVRRFSRTRLAAFSAAVLAYCLVRDADIWTFALLGLALLLIGLIMTVQGIANDPAGSRQRLHANWGRARRLVAVAGVLLVISLSTEVAASSAHRNPNLEDAFAVRIFPFPDRVAWFASEGMPQADKIDALVKASRPSAALPLVVKPDLKSSPWSPLAGWFARDGQTDYDLFLLLHPWYDLTAPFASPHLTFNDSSGNLAGYVPSGYPLAGWLGDLFNPNRVVEVVLGLAALMVAGLRGVWRRPDWRFTVLFGVPGLWSMLLAWHGEGMEVTRHMVEGNVEVRLGILLALLVGALASRPSSPPGVRVNGATRERVAPAPPVDAAASAPEKVLVTA
ncbi:MAG TPA: hypothetical protein VKR22_12775 [Acidimicrobiales bacterium]|nr:hypothetical protein [Acidimicrobiales bacterium]